MPRGKQELPVASLEQVRDDKFLAKNFAGRMDAIVQGIKDEDITAVVNKIKVKLDKDSDPIEREFVQLEAETSGGIGILVDDEDHFKWFNYGMGLNVRRLITKKIESDNEDLDVFKAKQMKPLIEGLGWSKEHAEGIVEKSPEFMTKLAASCGVDVDEIQKCYDAKLSVDDILKKFEDEPSVDDLAKAEEEALES